MYPAGLRIIKYHPFLAMLHIMPYDEKNCHPMVDWGHPGRGGVTRNAFTHKLGGGGWGATDAKVT